MQNIFNNEEAQKDLSWVMSRDNKFRYMYLSRLRSDLDYYLGYGGRREKHLIFNSKELHIHYIKTIWEGFLDHEKPQWLTWEDILDYQRRLYE